MENFPQKREQIYWLPWKFRSLLAINAHISASRWFVKSKILLNDSLQNNPSFQQGCFNLTTKRNGKWHTHKKGDVRCSSRIRITYSRQIGCSLKYTHPMAGICVFVYTVNVIICGHGFNLPNNHFAWVAFSIRNCFNTSRLNGYFARIFFLRTYKTIKYFGDVALRVARGHGWSLRATIVFPCKECREFD